jgi:transposase InsO family protein
MFRFSIKPLPEVDHWRNLAEYWHISPSAKQRLEWIIFYHTVGKRNARNTALYFGISPKTFHKWKGRFNPKVIQSLEEKSKAPIHKRTWMVTPIEEEGIVLLREKYLKYGKKKLKVLYFKKYHQAISTWKIERVIRKHKLYPDLVEHQKEASRRKKRPYKFKLRIHQLNQELDRLGMTIPPGKLWHTDSVEIWWYGQRRIIFTAIEDKTKLGYARVFTSSVSRNAADFLKRLVYLSEGDIRIIHSDNGSEFEKDFTIACDQLGIQQVYSRVKRPKDNPCLERFNWTVQDEWLSLSEIGLDDINEANQDLTPWLIEYNANRPHENLDYLTPLEYASQNYFKVLPMWSASTVQKSSLSFILLPQLVQNIRLKYYSYIKIITFLNYYQ